VHEAEPPRSPAPAAPPPQRKRTRVAILLSFLGAFLLLIVVFRGVLFPFLMAIFLAYLVEPVVATIEKGKHLGIRWSRGPVLILLYAVALTGLFLLVAVGINRTRTTLSSVNATLATEFKKRAEKVRFSFDEPSKTDVLIPRGTRVLYRIGPAVREFQTVYPTEIEADAVEAFALLEPVDGKPADPRAAPAPGDAPPAIDARLADPGALGIAVPPHVEAQPQASGFEILLERNVVAPISGLVERLTGEPYDPVSLRHWLADESEQRGHALGNRLLGWTRGLVFGIVGSTYQLILVLMLTAFIVIDRKNIASFFASLPPPHLKPHYHKLMEYVDRGLAGVIRGQLLICLVNGVLTWAGLVLLGIKYAALLGFVAGVFSLIPVFGTIASSIPIVLVAIAGGGIHDGLLALGWICLIHLLEANLLNPLIMGTNAEMHPVIIIFALLAGEHAFGVWGALLAVPTASIIQSCFKYYRHEIEGIPQEPVHGHGQWIRRLVARVRGRRAGEPAREGRVA
jgi:predicted PurR-regulated permease PerM